MYSEIVILAMLRQRPQHGYEIKKSIAQVFGGMVALNNKVLYPSLKQLETRGAVTREVIQQEGRPNRHLYRLTEQGMTLLHTLLCNFSPEQAANEAEFLTRVAFFEYLELAERETILTSRLAHVEAGLAYLQHLHQMGEETCTFADAQQRVLAFQLQQMHNEYQWLVTWIEEIQAAR
jgi:DNA-binding PadR family transcriptional regulator